MGDSAPNIELLSTSEAILTAFALTRATLSCIILGSFLFEGIETRGSDSVLVGLTFLVLAVVGLVSSVRMLLNRARKRPIYPSRPWPLIALDASLAIGVMAVVEAETSPLGWIALIAPVIETAVVFSMVPAGLVWVGLSLAFLALRLTSVQTDDAGAETLAVAVQQVLAVLLVSGPAALLSDSAQQRIDKLAEARRSADQIADRLRRIAQAASDMSQENSVESVLASVSHSAVTIGFDHADVVLRNADGSLRSHGSHSAGPFRMPPITLMIDAANASSITSVTEADGEVGQLLHTYDLASGHSIQINADSDGRTGGSDAILRAWSKRRPATEHELRALTLLAGHAREIHRAAELLADAKAHSDRLLYEVRHDGLTGLANRDFVLSTLEGTIADGTTTALYFIDLDGFKEINDTYGHRAGDAALVTTGRRLQELIRAGSLAGRMGGDEFIIMVPINVFDTFEGLSQFGESLVAAISEPMLVDDNRAQVGASVGLAVHSTGLDADQLISLADTAMYEAKRSGGGLKVSESTRGLLSEPAKEAS